ncbi:sensitized chromosome inheritance modifier 19 [Nesidiocoris tenuis]|uniref:Protein MCM10 homolog n=1 Tax=Nesidiocoris tenuis TaxID=355587 RepID=A0ABN7B2U2_9HEMI|nr:sensitized chromosome inheritance modifier 19 [Nesidiocoris tenuis]
MKKVLVDIPFLDAVDAEDTNPEVQPNLVEKKSKNVLPGKNDSVIHTGDTDSSDDEDNKYFEERTYNSCGTDIKKMLKKKSSTGVSYEASTSAKVPATTSNSYVFGLSASPPRKTSSETTTSSKTTADAYKDPVFGISIVNPLISSTSLKSMMTGRACITFARVRNHVQHGDLKKDWVVGGVVVTKSPTKVSQKGKNFTIWTLSDLKLGLQTVALFLFGKAFEKLWKTQPGTVIGVLNPHVLGNGSEKGEVHQAKLSVLDPDQVLILGRSKDLGTCKGKKKDGNDCTAFVNARECEYCSYHVASAYNQYRGRAELQSPTCGTLKSLQNKVLGKNEVFYGGKSFVAQPSKGTSKKVIAKDKQRLVNLGTSSKNVANPQPTTPLSLLSARSSSLLGLLENSSAEKSSKDPQKKDADRLNALSTPPLKSAKENNPCSAPSLVAPPVPKLSKKPQLSAPEGGVIEFDLPMPKKEVKPPTKQLGTPRPVSKNPLKKAPEKKSQNFFNSLIDLKPDPPVKKEQPSALSAGSSKTPGFASKAKDAVSDQHSAITSKSVVKKAPIEIEKPTDVLVERSPATINSLPVQGVEAIKTMVKAITRSPPAQRVSNAKLQAIQLVRRKGGITRENPRGISREEVVSRGLKRHLEEQEEESKEELKNSILSERFIELMSVESKHKDLLKEFDQVAEDLYYEKLEKKEQLEEKMLSIYKMECKAVRCMKCRYTWFSASEACKAEGHPIKVIDALKRFFKCNDCGNRTVSLSILPLLPCKKCNSTSWTKTTMMKEKIIKSSHQLSIRGGEQKFVNSQAADANINLLVPE